MAEQTLEVTSYTIKITKQEADFLAKVFDRAGKYIDYVTSKTYQGVLDKACDIMTKEDIRKLTEKGLL